jgi:hypothetical protein
VIDIGTTYIDIDVSIVLTNYLIQDYRRWGKWDMAEMLCYVGSDDDEGDGKLLFF